MNTGHYSPLVVIGAGSAGLTAARTAARLGAKVTLLERGKIGGDCLHTGCVPSKSLIHTARGIDQLNQTKKFVALEVGSVNYQKIHEAVQTGMHQIEEQSDNAEALQKDGITVVRGDYRFKDKHTLISSTGELVRFKKCIIASGSRPVIPKLSGIDTINYLTSDSVWDLETLPQSLAIIGGGPIGLELGQALAMLGSKVTIFERGERLVSRFDSFVSSALEAGLVASGVNIVYNSIVDSLESHQDGIALSYTVEGKKHVLQASHLLLAIGRSPATGDIGLTDIGITTDERGGIIVDNRLRTKYKSIYAVGDCLGGPLFTHWSAEQGAMAAVHALYGVGKAPNPSMLPSATFTTPEVAQLGASEQELVRKNMFYRKLTLPYDGIDKAVTEKAAGSITVLLDKKSMVLGAVIIGTNASELIGYFVLLMHNRAPFSALSKGVQAYPSYTIGLKQLAGDVSLENYGNSRLARLLLRIRKMC